MYEKYIAYIKNAGGNPEIEWFDDDWAPIGPKVRSDMVRAGLIQEIDGKIKLK